MLLYRHICVYMGVQTCLSMSHARPVHSTVTTWHTLQMSGSGGFQILFEATSLTSDNQGILALLAQLSDCFLASRQKIEIGRHNPTTRSQNARLNDCLGLHTGRQIPCVGVQTTTYSARS